MDADVVGQVVAVVLQAAQLLHPFVVRTDRQPLKEQIPALLVSTAEVGVEEGRAQDRPAVHHHVIDATQVGRGAGEELVALAAEAQFAQSGVQVVELAARVLDLFAQAVDEVLHQLLLGQAALASDPRFVFRQL